MWGGVIGGRKVMKGRESRVRGGGKELIKRKLRKEVGTEGEGLQWVGISEEWTLGKLSTEWVVQGKYN